MARPEVEAKTPFGQRLRDVRKALGDEERGNFAARLGISKGALALYERGEREPNTSILIAYYEKYGVNLNWLLTGHGEMFPQSQANGFIGSAMLDRNTLHMAVEAVEEGLSGRTIPSDKKAELILAAYDILIEDEDNKNNVIRLVRAA